MPITIPITEKQRATLTQLQSAVHTAQEKATVYTVAILDGADGVPEQFAGITLGPDGLVLGDAPDAGAPPSSPGVLSLDS